MSEVLEVKWDVVTKGASAIISQDGMTITSNGGSNTAAMANKKVSSGKHYAEFFIEVNNYSGFGVCGNDFNPASFDTNSLSPLTHVVGFELYRGFKQDRNGYGQSFATADTTSMHTIGLAIDVDNKTMTVYKDGVSLGVMNFTHLIGPYTFYAVAYRSTKSIARFKNNEMVYPIPDGYKAFADDKKEDILLRFNNKLYGLNSNEFIEIYHVSIDNFIKYGNSLEQNLNAIFLSKSYVLQNITETQFTQKPLSLTVR